MNTYNTKDEVLDKVFRDLGKLQTDLAISSSQDSQVSEMIKKTYEALETAKFATRGIYHTTKY